MAYPRKFVSIQPIFTKPDAGDIALFAIADDGTAWSAIGRIASAWEVFDGLEWEQIPSLPNTEDKKVPPVQPR